MKSIEDQAEEYAEALNDIADIMDLPTGQTPPEIVEAVREMRDRMTGAETLRAVLLKMYETPSGCSCEVSDDVIKVWAEARAVLFPMPNDLLSEPTKNAKQSAGSSGNCDR